MEDLFSRRFRSVCFVEKGGKILEDLHVSFKILEDFFVILVKR